MKWPWRKTEKRESGGSFTDAVVRLLEQQAAGNLADTGSTAAVEAAAGALARAFAAARVDGPAHVRQAVTAGVLAQIGRDLVRGGQSLHVIEPMGSLGLSLLPAASWHWEGDADPSTWRVRATYHGPSTSTTRLLPYAGVVFLKWGSAAGQPYTGTGPLSWASLSATLGAETERSLRDEAKGPIAQLVPIPQDGGDGEEGDPLAELKADVKAARGKALLVETTAAGWDAGPGGAPRQDWKANRLGPNPPQTMAQVLDSAFFQVLAATGTPPSLFRPNADGTAQRESLRRWHMGTVIPMARLVEAELSAKLEADVSLRFDSYPLDMAGRAQAFDKLVRNGVDPRVAMEALGLLLDA